MSANWPTVLVSSHATRVTGRADLDWALVEAFRGVTTTTTGFARVMDYSTSPATYRDVAVGTPVIVEDFSNAGFNGIQMRARIIETGELISYGWSHFDEAPFIAIAAAAA